MRRAESKLDDGAFIVDHCSVMHITEILDSVYYKYENFRDDNSSDWNHNDAIFLKRLNEKMSFSKLTKFRFYLIGLYQK